MTLRLYDTASRSTREFVPVTPGHCGIYLCGPTVQATPHIGHLRSGLNYDVLRRWLTRTGYQVTFVQNVTDIDDKILAKSAEAGVDWWALAYANEVAYGEGYATLGCLPPTIAPRATGHVPEMVELMRELIDAGHGYAAGGDVYFAVTTFDAYGALSGQRLDHMQAAADGPAEGDMQAAADGSAEGDVGSDAAPAGRTDKRDPRDFAMWKAHKPGEPATASWPTPWGRGRPGWHLECSAMAGRYLGDTFDIHGGGLDLVFPHHENELAQSRAAGRGFANYWVHHGLLNLGGEKMSKSIGNVIGLDHVLTLVRPVELRYYLTAPHYRSTIDYSEDSLVEAASAYRRIENFVQRATERFGVAADAGLGVLCAEFTAAMDDDLGTPKAVAAIHDTVREGNAALAAGEDTAARGALAGVRAMLDVLGLDPLSPRWSGGAGSDLHGVVDGLVRVALEQRQLARARKDFAAADAVRDQLKHAGVLVEDTPDGPRWTLADPGVLPAAGDRTLEGT